MPDIQEGIYFRQGERAETSFCIIFLGFKGKPTADSMVTGLTQIWDVLTELQEDMGELTSYGAESNPNNFSRLLAYGYDIFSIPGIAKQPPNNFNKSFFTENVKPGEPLFTNSDLRYSVEIKEDPIPSSYALLQLISSNEGTTKLGWAKIWEHLRSRKKANDDEGLFIKKFYTGFNRPDNRSWTGFNDGISNMRSSEREPAIVIKEGDLNSSDGWMVNGTYMAYIRMVMDLEGWNDIDPRIQERVIGRDKSTGCPLVGVENGTNILVPGCPAPNTINISQFGNDIYRDSMSGVLDSYDYSYNSLDLRASHVRQMVDGSKQTDSNGKPSRIFRQGYEFLENLDIEPYFRVGLNFVSFQNNPEKVFNLLKYGFTEQNLEGTKVVGPSYTLSDFISVESAGIFLVPPYSSKKELPGKALFVA
jgi:Dyp-type peroxidase family